jgi:hypothetical protein
MLMSKTLIKKGLNTDIINHIYSFLTYKDEFDKVIQHLNEACLSNCQHPRPLGSAYGPPLVLFGGVVIRQINIINHLSGGLLH